MTTVDQMTQRHNDTKSIDYYHNHTSIAHFNHCWSEVGMLSANEHCQQRRTKFCGQLTTEFVVFAVSRASWLSDMMDSDTCETEFIDMRLDDSFPLVVLATTSASTVTRDDDCLAGVLVSRGDNGSSSRLSISPLWNCKTGAGETWQSHFVPQYNVISRIIGL